MLPQSEELRLRRLLEHGLDHADPHIRFHALMLRKRLEDLPRLSWDDARGRCVERIRYHAVQMERTHRTLEEDPGEGI